MENIKIIKNLICKDCKKDLNKFNGQKIYMNKSNNEIVCSSCFAKKNIGKDQVDIVQMKFPDTIQRIIDLEKKLEFLKGKQFFIKKMFSFIENKANVTRKEISAELAKNLFGTYEEITQTEKKIETKINEDIKNKEILND